MCEGRSWIKLLQFSSLQQQAKIPTVTRILRRLLQMLAARIPFGMSTLATTDRTLESSICEIIKHTIGTVVPAINTTQEEVGERERIIIRGEERVVLSP